MNPPRSSPPPRVLLVRRRAVCAGLFGGLIAAGAPAAAYAAVCSEGLPPVTAEALRRAVGRADVRRLYERLAWRPAWSEAAERGLLAALAGAERHAVSVERLIAAVRSSPCGAAREAGLAGAALDYANVLAHGAVDPSAINDIFTIPRNRVDVVAGLADALLRGAVEAWLESLAPADEEYRALSRAYLERRGSFAGLLPHVEDGPAIRAGLDDPRMPAIRRVLVAKGYLLAAPAGEASLTFDAASVEAIRRLQSDEGIEIDGVIGPDTLWAMNAGPSDHARQIALNLERWRWLERSPPATRIDVNTAAAELTYWRDGRAVLSERVVVGRADWATPSLGASFEQLVVNPPWNVPSSIARREILPRGAAYLRRNNMYMRGGRVVQRPGPGSALGLVKFDMRNRHAIYLHDTPSKSLFASEDRHRSHGCVRVRNAVEFARRLAEERGQGERFERALSSGRTTVVPLGDAIPVRLLYRTAFVREGRVVYTPDPYDRDEALAAALGMAADKHRSRHRYSEIPLGP